MNLVHIRRYFRDSRVPGWRKFVVVGAVAYVLMPLDLLPDVVPLLGWLDDIGAIGAALAFFVRDVSAHAERRDTPALSAADDEGVQIIDAQAMRVQR